jgi:hypothetical protein
LHITGVFTILKNSGRGKALEYRRIKKALEIVKNLLGNGFSVEQAAKLAGSSNSDFKITTDGHGQTRMN